MRAKIFADNVYVNGTIITMKSAGDNVSAVATKDGQIIMTGSLEDVQPFVGDDTRHIDLQGRTMLPGFIDPHSHFPDSGELALHQVDLNPPPIGKITTIRDLQVKLKEHLPRLAEGEWLVGYNYDDTLMAEQRHPTKADLDAVSMQHPIWCSHISGHLGVANSKALELAGLRYETLQPEGGFIHKDEHTETLTGQLDEPAAMDYVIDLLPQRSFEEFEAIIAHAAAEYAAQGITCAQNAWSRMPLLNRLVAVTERGNLPIRVIAFPHWEDALEISAGRKEFNPPVGNRLIKGAAKVFADGSIQGYTGYLSEPYYKIPNHISSANECGYPIYTVDTLKNIVAKLYEAGWQVAIHGNGDAAIDDIISAHRFAQSLHPANDMRHIVVHAQMAREDQLDAMKELELTPSFFSLHVYYWGDRHRDQFIGPQRAARISPAKSALNRGMRFTIHCDTPIVPMTTLKLMACAVNRKTTSGKVLGGEQAIDVYTALRTHTTDAAWQMRVDHILGTIEVGKLADFVILDRDPTKNPKKLEDVQILATIVADHTVYRACHTMSLPGSFLNSPWIA